MGMSIRWAEAVSAGAREAGASEVSLWQVPELVPDEILEGSGAAVARAAFAHVPIAKPTQLAEADAIIFGTPTRFGNRQKRWAYRARVHCRNCRPIGGR